MKKVLIGFLASLGVTVVTASGQNFINLDFESANNLPAPGSAVPVANALPGWSAFAGTNQLSQVEYNPSVMGIPGPVDLVGSNASVIDGNFSVYLHGGSISQTALVSVGTQSLLFDANTGSSPLVSIGGQNLSITAISSGITSSGLSYNTYAADVSAYAGLTETLTFSGGATLDDIQFSQVLVPEPSSNWLLFLGSGALVWAFLRQSTAQKGANLNRCQIPDLVPNPVH